MSATREATDRSIDPANSGELGLVGGRGERESLPPNVRRWNGEARRALAGAEGTTMTARRWTWRVGLGVALAATLAAAAPAPRASQKTVSIKDSPYGPGARTVARGTTVTWVNHDEEVQTVTSGTGAFGSTGLGHDETFAQTFTQPGSYQYFCALHPKMRATVVVR